jgi:hypothetical protein
MSESHMYRVKYPVQMCAFRPSRRPLRLPSVKATLKTIEGVVKKKHWGGVNKVIEWTFSMIY